MAQELNQGINLQKPHTGQQRILDAALRFNVLQCGRRFGKTTMGLHILRMAGIMGKTYGWFAPTYKSMSEQWNDIEASFAPLIRKTDKQNREIYLINGGRFDFWSLEKPDAGRGRKYHGIIIDEASVVRDLKSRWEQDIRPTLTDYKGRAWVLGTPKGQNYFHQLFLKGQRGDRDWKSWRLGTIDNPTIPDLEQELIDAQKDLPDAVYKQEYLGVPADDGGNPFGVDAIRACFGERSHKPAIWFGWDLAKSHDWTWGVGLDEDGCQVFNGRFQKSWGETKQSIIEMTEWNPALIDSTGVGDPIVEDLIMEGSNFEGFKFSSTSKQALMMGLRAAIQQNRVRFFDEALKSELESFTYEYSPGGGVKYTAPDGMHDDGVMALALAVEKMRRGSNDGVIRSASGFKLGTAKAQSSRGITF
jgi:hypothetical protein